MPYFYGVKQRYAGHRLNVFFWGNLFFLYFVIKNLLWAVSQKLFIGRYKPFEIGIKLQASYMGLPWVDDQVLSQVLLQQFLTL